MSNVNPVPLVEDNPKRPYKAYAGAVASGVAVFLGAWIGDDDPFTKKEAAQAFIGALVITLPGFGIVFTVANPKRRKR